MKEPNLLRAFLLVSEVLTQDQDDLLLITLIVHEHGSGAVVLAGEFGCADTVIIHLGRPT